MLSNDSPSPKLLHFMISVLSESLEASLRVDTVSLTSSGLGFRAVSREVIRLLKPFFIDEKPVQKKGGGVV